MPRPPLTSLTSASLETPCWMENQGSRQGAEAAGSLLARQSVPLPCKMLQLVTQELSRQNSEGQSLQEPDRALIHGLALALQKLAEHSARKKDAFPIANVDVASARGFSEPQGKSELPPASLTQTALEADTSKKDAEDVEDRPVENQFVEAGSVATQIAQIPPKLRTQRSLAMMGAGASNGRHPSYLSIEEVFAQLDKNNSGSLSRNELRRALREVNVPSARVQKILKLADADRSGDISLEEFRKACVHAGTKELKEILAKVITRTSGVLDENLAEMDEKPKPWTMVHPDGWFRFFWDLILVLTLIYVTFVLPIDIAWGNAFSDDAQDIFDKLSWAVDIIFWIDMPLNFRTGYYDYTGNEVMSPCRVACHYLRTWFALDLISSIPFDRFSDIESQILKIGKVGKIARVLKFFKPKRALKHLIEHIDDHTNTAILKCRRRSGILLIMVVLAHWTACSFRMVEDKALAVYQDVSGSIKREYLASLYWAITTLTTVGYGDITPQTDEERLCAMIVMILGGAFYGYIIGVISSVVATTDLNASAYHEHMDKVYAWMDFHKFPVKLRRKIRHHFQALLADKSALAEIEIVSDLSASLLEECGQYLLAEEVTENPLFDGLSTSSVMRIQRILHETMMEENGTITKQGESGSSMYLIRSGTVSKSSDGDETTSNAVLELNQGDSFGEEVLMGIKEKYEYSTVATTPVTLSIINEDELAQIFGSMPDVMARMKSNAMDMM